MDFRLLQARLLAQLRMRIRNGEITERSLARLSGISQPHIHNVLKGKRLLSIEGADRILRRLQIDLEDLLPGGARGALACQTEPPGASCQTVPLLDGWIGPGNPYPHATGPERHPFPAADLQELVSPVLARLLPDPQRAPLFSGGGMVLLDRAEGPRLEPDEDAHFALDLCEESAVGMVRRDGRGLYEWAYRDGAWRPFPLPDRRPLDLIKGRVRLLIRPL